MPDPTPERIAAALALAEAVESWVSSHHGAYISGSVMDGLVAYRATAPKLRTRAEVAWLLRLCAEPTTPTDSGPSSDSAPPSALPTGAAYSRLRDRISRLERATEYAPYQGKHQALREIRDELERDASGPRPIPATKESSDTAGVDAGVAKTDPLRSFDAVVWAREFMRLLDDGTFQMNADPGEETINEDLMRAWFANALMRGYDEHAWRYPQPHPGMTPAEPNRVTDHDADQREPDACSCDESEALRVKLEEAEAKCLEWQQVTARLQRSEAEMADKLQECRRLLGFVYERAKEITQVTEEIP